MSIIPKQNLVGYWPLDGHALDMSTTGKIAYGGVDAQGSSSTGTTATVSFSPPAKENSMLIVSVFYISLSDLVTGVTYGSTAMTRVGWAKDATNQSLVFYALPIGTPDGTSKTITATLSSGTAATIVSATTYTGVEQTVPTDTAYTATQSVSLTTTKPNAWVIGVFRASSGNGSASTNTTQRSTLWTDRLLESSLNPIATPSSVTLAMTGATGGLVFNAMAMYPARVIGANNGTVTGAIPVPSQNPAIPASLAYSFNGSSDFIDMGTASQLSITNITISCWFKTTTVANNQCLVSKMATTNNGYYIVTRSDNTLWWGLGNTGATDVASVGKYATNRWHHFVGTFDGSNLKCFLDGNKGTDAASSKTFTATANFNIGRIGTPTAYFPGKIQDVALFNKALTKQEIQAIYNQSKQKYTSKGWLSNLITVIRTSDLFQFFFK